MFENGDYISVPKGATLFSPEENIVGEREAYLASMTEYNKFIEEMRISGFEDEREGLHLSFYNNNKEYTFSTYFYIKGYVILIPLSFYDNQQKLDYEVIVM